MLDFMANIVVDRYSGNSEVTAWDRDVMAHKYVPLPALLKKSVSTPLQAQ